MDKHSIVVVCFFGSPLSLQWAEVVTYLKFKCITFSVALLLLFLQHIWDVYAGATERDKEKPTVSFCNSTCGRTWGDVHTLHHLQYQCQLSLGSQCGLCRSRWPSAWPHWPHKACSVFGVPHCVVAVLPLICVYFEFKFLHVFFGKNRLLKSSTVL